MFCHRSRHSAGGVQSARGKCGLQLKVLRPLVRVMIRAMKPISLAMYDRQPARPRNNPQHPLQRHACARTFLVTPRNEARNVLPLRAGRRVGGAPVARVSLGDAEHRGEQQRVLRVLPSVAAVTLAAFSVGGVSVARQREREVGDTLERLRNTASNSSVLVPSEWRTVAANTGPRDRQMRHVRTRSRREKRYQ